MDRCRRKNKRGKTIYACESCHGDRITHAQESVMLKFLVAQSKYKTVIKLREHLRSTGKIEPALDLDTVEDSELDTSESESEDEEKKEKEDREAVGDKRPRPDDTDTDAAVALLQPETKVARTECTSATE
jgi:hypothetical protein